MPVWIKKLCVFMVMACGAFICQTSLAWGESDALPAPEVVEPYSVGGYVAQHEQAATRLMYGLNVGWRYAEGERKPESGVLEYDDSAWVRVNFPYVRAKHYLEHKEGEKTACVYHFRKVMDVPAELAGRRNILYFDSYVDYDIYVNGQQLAPVTDPATRGVDVSSLLKPGAKNVLELTTSCNPYSVSLPLDRFGVSGNVYLISTGQIYLSGGVGEAGIYYATVKTDTKKKTATVKVRVQVANDADVQKRVQVHVLMTDPKAFDPVGDADSLVLPPHSKKTIEKELSLEKVRFWSPESPNLYQLGIDVWSDEGGDNPVELLDSQMLRVGVRTLECAEPGKIILNGKEWSADKATIFSDLPCRCGVIARTDNQHWLLSAKMHREGVKLACFAPGVLPCPAFLDACDKLGILVIACARDRANQLINIPSYMRNRPSVWMDNHPEFIAEVVPKDTVGVELLVGRPVAEDEVLKAGTPVKLSLKIDSMDGMPFIANGADEWRILAELQDEKGNPVPMKKAHVVNFYVEGAGEVTSQDVEPGGLYRDAEYRRFSEGTVRVSDKAGKVKITAKTLLPNTENEVSAVLEFDTAPSGMKMLSAADVVVKPVEQNDSAEPAAPGVEEQPKPQDEQAKAEEPQPQDPPDEEPLPPLYPEEPPPTFGQLIRKALDWLFPWPFGCANQ